MKNVVQKKIDEIQDLLQKKADIERRLEELLAPSPKPILPNDFSLNDEILKIVRENFGGISRQEITRKLQHAFPSYGIDIKKIASSLAYLKNRKNRIRKIGHGQYAPSQEIPDAEAK